MPPETAKSDRLGIDDWAWRKGQRYSVPAVLSRCGPLLVDSGKPSAGRRCPADRTAETVTAWLRSHPGVELDAPIWRLSPGVLAATTRSNSGVKSERRAMPVPADGHAVGPGATRPRRTACGSTALSAAITECDGRQTLDLPAASRLAWRLVCTPEKVEPGQTATPAPLPSAFSHCHGLRAGSKLHAPRAGATGH